MTPINFGPSQRRMFGLFHPAEERRVTNAAVLLCYPFGHEALRIHRFYRLMAERLSRQGVAVLRFDYHATGDSPGDDEQGEMTGWAQDICEAHRELLRRSGASQVTWFGARLGANLALAAAPQSMPRVQKLVLWDAIFDGTTYLKELHRAQVEELELSHNIPDPAWRSSLTRDTKIFEGECLGFAISPKLRQQMAGLDTSSPAQFAPNHISLMADPDDDAAKRWASTIGAKHAGAKIEYASFKHPLIWTSNPFANNEMVPAEALQKMMGELNGKQ
ncbi:alpha/beta hydrolase [Variovorax sp. J22R133]|uniref:serine aminopeptidase domain-containing protein n=1 Tax=Variovorax brevis TaxID=3053503 RepID=UPI0025760AE1|nr:alpha/beta hydrolase [Variovorax sp. J22R133]MDM0115082.1 alpha/beta hydrolase [Variovorax sp. J22R133]